VHGVQGGADGGMTGGCEAKAQHSLSSFRMRLADEEFAALPTRSRFLRHRCAPRRNDKITIQRGVHELEARKQ